MAAILCGSGLKGKSRRNLFYKRERENIRVRICCFRI